MSNNKEKAFLSANGEKSQEEKTLEAAARIAAMAEARRKEREAANS